MSITVCLLARTLTTPTAGGHMWVYLNWALGLKALGCRVIWLEVVSPATPSNQVQALTRALRSRLAPFGLHERIALSSTSREPLTAEATAGSLDLDAAAEADLFLDIAYAPAHIVERFRRSAMLDIDPGLCQLWVSRGQIDLPRHDVYLTIGETVGRPEARFPDCGVEWRHITPCIALNWWPVSREADRAPFTTVSNWIMYDYWVDDDNGGYPNDKRTGFLPFLDLPRYTSQPLELALSLGGAEEERHDLERRGWRVREAHEIVANPQDYQRYIQRRAASSAARSLPVCACRTRGSATARCATWPAENLPWSSTLARAGSCPMQPASFASQPPTKRRNNWSSSPPTTTGNVSSAARSPRSTSTPERSRLNSSSSHSTDSLR